MQQLESRHKGYKVHTDLWRHDEKPGTHEDATASYWEKKEGGRLKMFINENLMFWHLQDDDLEKYSADEIAEQYDAGKTNAYNNGVNVLAVFDDGQGGEYISPRRFSHIIEKENPQGQYMADMYGYKRRATTEEAKTWREFYKKDQAQAIDRLKKYFKRYGDKVQTRTYWADR